MTRDELLELHYICPQANLSSIMQMGLLSNRRARQYNPQSIAMPEIQDRRARVRVPGGRPLHEYVNLYICARNPMMFVRRHDREHLCVLSISTDVLDLPHDVVSDQNASSDYVRFAPAPGGLAIVNHDMTFAKFWTHQDPIQQFRNKSAKCAEVLVPEWVAPEYIETIYVCSAQALARVQATNLGITVMVNGDLFFV